jgi:hypothetical protein
MFWRRIKIALANYVFSGPGLVNREELIMRDFFTHVYESLLVVVYISRKILLGKSPVLLAVLLMRLKSRNPRTFNEKILYKMARDRRVILSLVADKLAVREYVSEKVGEQYLTKLYRVFGKNSDLDFSELPRNFVLKPNHGSGAALIVADFVPKDSNSSRFSTRIFKKYYLNPDSLDISKISRLVRFWLGTSYYKYHRIGYPEWGYKNIKRSVFAEELLVKDDSPPQDFRFFIFNGICEAIMVDTPGYGGVRRDVYSTTWEKLQVSFAYQNSELVRPVPNNLPEMINVAEKLAEDLDHARIDLYNIDGRIVFGEITNYHAGGTQKFSPLSYDFELGRNWKPFDFY